MGQYFNGKFYIEPGADVATDYDASPKVSSLSSSIALIIGRSTNGLSYKDKKVYEFTSPTDAKSVLKGGPAMDVITCAFNPSNQVAGATSVLFVRANSGEPATFKASNGSVLNKLKYAVTVTSPDELAGSVGFSISINGAAKKAVSVNITSTLEAALSALEYEVNKLDGVKATASATALEIEGVTDAVEIKMDSLLNPFGATAVGTTEEAFSPEYVEKGLTIVSKDKGNAINMAIKESEGSYFFYLDGNLVVSFEGIGSVSQLIEQASNSIAVSRIMELSAEDTNTPLPKTGGAIVPFTVVPDTDMTMQSFLAALDLSATYNKAVVLCDTDNEGYHQAIMNYCLSGTDYGCYGFVGGALGETPSVVQTRALALNSKLVTLAYPGIYLNLTGEKKLYSPVLFAAKLGGLACGLEPQTPLTRKVVSVLGFEDIDLEGNSIKTVRESLINSGVTFGCKMSAGYIVNKGITTIQNQANRQILGVDNMTPEISVSRIELQMQKEIRDSAASTFPGTTRLYPSRQDVVDFYKTYFNEKVGTFLTGWDDQSLKVWVDEDAWFGSATVYVNGPINHAFFTLSFALDDNL